jgi:hypothetical protein
MTNNIDSATKKVFVNNQQTEPPNNISPSNSQIRNGIILIFLYFIILSIVAFSFEKLDKTKNSVSIVLFSVILFMIFVLIFIVGGENVGNSISANSSLLTRLFYAVLFIAFVLFLFNLFYLSSTFFWVVFVAIVIVSLAILFNVFRNHIIRSTKNNRWKFAIEIVFFIPCLFNDFMLWGLEQFKMTPYITWVLFFIEFVLIASYIYFPRLMQKINIRDGTMLWNPPYYINTGRERVIATDTTLKIRDMNSQRQKPLLWESISPLQFFPEWVLDTLPNWIKPPPKKDETSQSIDVLKQTITPVNYAFSMWINLSPQKVANEISLFRYGFGNSYKPKITYDNNDIYKVYFSEQTDAYEIKVPNQKWNQFVLNYVDGVRAELWLNGKMQRVMYFSEMGGMPKYEASDQVVIGNNQNTGLHGAIGNVVFFSKSLDSTEIVNMYNVGNPRFPENPRM